MNLKITSQWKKNKFRDYSIDAMYIKNITRMNKTNEIKSAVNNKKKLFVQGLTVKNDGSAGSD